MPANDSPHLQQPANPIQQQSFPASLSDTAALREYTMLKAEQISRIAQRDHLLYANLGVVGAICYFAFSEHGTIHALLAIPWASFILGWTYLCNDEKVSNIREYIRATSHQHGLSPELPAETLFAWESTHRAGKHRMRFKITQLVVDITTFVLSGLAALFTYVLGLDAWPWWQYVAVAIEAVVMIALATEFTRHFLADTRDLRKTAIT